MDAASTSENHRKDWPGAFRAMRKLLADPADTVQVFRVMHALNAGTSERNYARLLKVPGGAAIAASRVELVELLTDLRWLDSFGPGTVGAAYRAFLDRTGFSANGLADVSKQVPRGDEAEEKPSAWFGRRERDTHDIQHVLTGYRADDPLGELCLVAYTYAQNNGLGWAFIAVMGALRSLTQPHGWDVLRAVWEGYRHGRRAAWLHGQDIAKLFAEPIDAARARLRIARPLAYERAQQKVRAGTSSWLATAS